MRQGIVLCQDGGVKQEAGPEGGRGRELPLRTAETLHGRGGRLSWSRVRAAVCRAPDMRLHRHRTKSKHVCKVPGARATAGKTL